MSRYQAIALDMDGTLLNRDHKISSATRAALAQARAHDIKVLLVTGRHFMTARPFHHELALDTPIICSNGAYLYDPVQERILAGDPLAVAPSPPCWRRCRPSRWGRCSTWGRHRLPGLRGARGPDAALVGNPAGSPQGLPAARRGYRVLVAVPIWKLELFNQDPGRLHRFVGEVVERLPFTRDWAAPMRWSWCSQVAARATGWPSGRRGGIAMENLVAFGDNNNDISMFEQVGLAVAMGNAAPQIQAHADRVTADHNEDGIALALQRWVLPA